jgi:hypothetical protein
MFDISDPDFRDKLASRLAHKTGLQKEHARKFLDALSEVNSEEQQEHNLPGHMISIPLVEQEDGTMIVDTSGHSAWWPFSKPRSPRPPGSDPGPYPGPGAYPGPSVHIRVNDWLGADLRLDERALGRLRNALAKTETPRLSKDLSGHDSSGSEKLKQK